MLSLLQKHEHLDFRGNYFFGRFFKLLYFLWQKICFWQCFFQISRLIRIRHFHQSGLEKLKESSSEKDLKLLSYDIYQLELIEITSIIEVSLREFFVCLVYLIFQNTKNKYFDSIIKKSTGNDFMNIGKANTIIKKH